MPEPQTRPSAASTRDGRRVKALIVASHPVQYTVPMYRRFAADPRLDVRVAFCSMQGAEEGFDSGFGMRVKWNVPMLDGYRWENPTGWSLPSRLGAVLGHVNPGLAGLIRRWRPDVVVCWGYQSVSDWIAFAAARTHGAAFVRSCETHHWESRDPRGWKPRLKRFVIPRIYRNADAVIAVSSASVRFLGDLGVPNERVFLMPFSVDNAFFAEAAAATKRDAIRAKWGVGPNDTVALLCGKMIPYKRPIDLLEAAARVESLHVAFAGDGELRGEIEQRAHDLGIESRVHLLGFINQQELPGVYASADVLVVPSEWENFPLVVPEAMASGLPVIATETCSAVGDVVLDGVTGFVVSVGDVATIAERLSRLVADKGLRQRLGENARTRMETWGPEDSAKAFGDACMSATRRSRQRR